MKFRKGIYVFWGTFMLSLFFIQGCQKSPEEDIVVNKNEGAMENAIAQSGNSENKDDNIPESYLDNFMTASNDLEIIVDAEVTAEGKPLPAIRVKPHEITSDELKLWADVLFEGKTAYEPVVMLTKAEIEQEILWRKQKINDKDALIEEHYGNEAEADSLIEYYESQIAGYEKDYETAPETYEKKESDWTFHPWSYYNTDASHWEGSDEAAQLDKTVVFKANVDNLNGHKATIDAYNRTEEDYQMHSLWFYYLDEEVMGDITYKELSKEEATEMADEIKNELGLTEWELWDIRESTTDNECAYKLTYSPLYEGIPTLLGSNIDLQSEELYAANFYYELLEIRVINGIVRNVELTSPTEVVDVVNSNVEVISFEKAYELFKNQIQSEYSKSMFLEGSTEEDEELQEWLENTGFKIEITSIQQGLFRIKVKDNSEEFMMVPAWAFAGTTYMDGQALASGNLVVINAIDGSTINTDLGY